ncbi:HopJ type III effector protein [Mangrovimonas xylaniphaga]|uniref:HopJ type III effector protein n=1 Tax=Mangrovimonas xylaniphaga TaxID=1645915 RepID=UPI0006B66E4B|nr:HopJ type III effector protein [Mangrovimonas xylaniphaga]
MTIDAFKQKLQSTPTQIEFAETMAVVEANYAFTPTAFTNGNLHNKAGENSGSCKLLAFAQLQGFSQEDTLACFGKFYFDEVLNDPNGTGHQNIRNFMATGFEGLSFEGSPLQEK